MNNHTVVVYSTSTCHYCQVAKDFLRGQNIPFTEYNVGLDPEKRQEMIELTGQMGVPVIVIDGEPMVGYSEARLRELLLPNGSTTPPAEGTSSDSLWDKMRSALGVK
jgi:glutaredoxin 3